MSNNIDNNNVDYIEDYLSDDIIDKVEDALENIPLDNVLNVEDFYTTVFSLLDSDEEANRLLEFINNRENTTRKDLMIFIIKMKRHLI